MKTFAKLAGAAIIASFALSGCAPAAAPPAPLSPAAEVVSTIDAFYDKSIEKAPEAANTFNSGPEEMGKLLSPEDLKILDESSDPFTGLNSISPEAQKQVADLYKGLDPVSEFYNYEGMSDSEVAGVALTSLITTTFLESAEVAEAARNVNESNVTIVDENHAVSNFKAGVDVENSQDEMYLVKTDAGWKIDGRKTYDEYYADMKE